MLKLIALYVLVAQLLFLVLSVASHEAKVSQFKKIPYKQDPTLKLKLVLDQDSQRHHNDLFNNKSSLISAHHPSPVIFWHGMGDTAYGSINSERLALQKKFPGMQIYSIQIGSNVLEDELASYFSNVNEQIQQACQAILNCNYIKQFGSFNAIGYSQGAQFVRALIQRCPFRENNILIKNFISIGGQHQGVYGLPRCNLDQVLCNYARHLLTEGAYNEQIQKHLVQAQYWHNPINEHEYKTKNIFLADINNELTFINETYRNNLLNLTNLVLIGFQQDEMVIPRESSLFGFYLSGQDKEIVSLELSSLYLEDRLGLKQLNEQNRLKMIQIPGRHLQYKMSWFLDNIASVYLNN